MPCRNATAQNLHGISHLLFHVYAACRYQLRHGAPADSIIVGGLSFKNLIVLRHCSYVGWVDHAPRPSKEGPTPDHASGGGVPGKDRRNVDVPFGLLSEKRLSSTFAILKNGSELAGNGAKLAVS